MNSRKLSTSTDQLFSLTEGGAVVHRDKSGKVSPLWLGACETERTQTADLMEKIADPLNLQRAYRRVKANAGQGGVDVRYKVERLDRWIRRRLRCYRLRQCKRVIGIVRWLRNLGVEETLNWRTALSGKSWWRLSNSPACNMGMNNQWFTGQGYYSLYTQYLALHRKPL